jgi:predicted RNA binding protein YcfA (HicA-like mRNA interferase family)
MSGRGVVREFEKLGWQVARQRATHIILVKEGARATLSVPDHKEVARGTLRSLIRERSRMGRDISYCSANKHRQH